MYSWAPVVIPGYPDSLSLDVLTNHPQTRELICYPLLAATDQLRGVLVGRRRNLSPVSTDNYYTNLILDSSSILHTGYSFINDCLSDLHDNSFVDEITCLDMTLLGDLIQLDIAVSQLEDIPLESTHPIIDELTIFNSCFLELLCSGRVRRRWLDQRDHTCTTANYRPIRRRVLIDNDALPRPSGEYSDRTVQQLYTMLMHSESLRPPHQENEEQRRIQMEIIQELTSRSQKK